MYFAEYLGLIAGLLVTCSLIPQIIRVFRLRSAREISAVFTVLLLLGLLLWLVYGIMREESGFNPRAESYAHALGLMQLLEKTARWMAEDTKIRVSRRRLRRPDINVALGTKFLRYLFDELRHPALAVAGYNCGKGGINRVRRRVRTRRLDEFIEAIPYDQTRRYTKRVLSSAAIYRHLHWGGWRPGSVSLKIPRIKKGK